MSPVMRPIQLVLYVECDYKRLKQEVNEKCAYCERNVC